MVVDALKGFMFEHITKKTELFRCYTWRTVSDIKITFTLARGAPWLIWLLNSYISNVDMLPIYCTCMYVKNSETLCNRRLACISFFKSYRDECLMLSRRLTDQLTLHRNYSKNFAYFWNSQLVIYFLEIYAEICLLSCRFVIFLKILVCFKVRNTIIIENISGM